MKSLKFFLISLLLIFMFTDVSFAKSPPPTAKGEGKSASSKEGKSTGSKEGKSAGKSDEECGVFYTYAGWLEDFIRTLGNPSSTVTVNDILGKLGAVESRLSEIDILVESSNLDGKTDFGPYDDALVRIKPMLRDWYAKHYILQLRAKRVCDVIRQDFDKDFLNKIKYLDEDLSDFISIEVAKVNKMIDSGERARNYYRWKDKSVAQVTQIAAIPNWLKMADYSYEGLFQTSLYAPITFHKLHTELKAIEHLCLYVEDEIAAGAPASLAALDAIIKEYEASVVPVWKKPIPVARRLKSQAGALAQIPFMIDWIYSANVLDYKSDLESAMEFIKNGEFKKFDELVMGKSGTDVVRRRIHRKLINLMKFSEKLLRNLKAYPD